MLPSPSNYIYRSRLAYRPTSFPRPGANSSRADSPDIELPTVGWNGPVPGVSGTVLWSHWVPVPGHRYPHFAGMVTYSADLGWYTAALVGLGIALAVRIYDTLADAQRWIESRI